jgi:hypothetical protein
MIGAGQCAGTAADAKSVINVSNAILDIYAFVIAGGNAVAQTYAAVGALSGSAKQGLCGRAAGNAHIFHLVFGYGAVALALDESALFNHLPGFLAENCGHCLSTGSTTGGTEGERSLGILNQRGSIAVAAGESAAGCGVF